MARTLAACLFVVLATSVVARSGGRGGKGGGCRSKFSPCVDNSKPLCPDKSEPDKETRPPSCATGGSPVCSDGSEPRSPQLGESEERNRKLQERRDMRDDNDNNDDNECG